jgi:hypothetical protein
MDNVGRLESPKKENHHFEFTRSVTSSASLGNMDRWRDRWDLLHALELFIKIEYMVLGLACSIDSTFCVFISRALKSSQTKLKL